MKELLLIVGLVVFSIFNNVVNSKESDLSDYHCIQSPKPFLANDTTTYCFCITFGNNRGEVFSSKIGGDTNTFCNSENDKKISYEIFLERGGLPINDENLTPVNDQFIKVKNHEVKKWLKENKN